MPLHKVLFHVFLCFDSEFVEYYDLLERCYMLRSYFLSIIFQHISTIDPLISVCNSIPGILLSIKTCVFDCLEYFYLPFF